MSSLTERTAISARVSFRAIDARLEEATRVEQVKATSLETGPS